MDGSGNPTAASSTNREKRGDSPFEIILQKDTKGSGGRKEEVLDLTDIPDDPTKPDAYIHVKNPVLKPGPGGAAAPAGATSTAKAVVIPDRIADDTAAIALVFPDVDREKIGAEIVRMFGENLSRVPLMLDYMAENVAFCRKDKNAAAAGGPGGPDDKKSGDGSGAGASGSGASGSGTAAAPQKSYKVEDFPDEQSLTLLETRNKTVEDNYYADAMNFLQQTFKRTSIPLISDVLLERGNLMLAYKHLKGLDPQALNNNKSERKARPWTGVPRTQDPNAAKELLKIVWVIQHMDEIRFMWEKERIEYEEAEARGELLECGCCYSSYLINKMAACSEGHLFCIECCRRAAAEVIGQNKTKLTCFDSSGCQAEFPLAQVERFLDDNTYLKLAQRRAAADIRASGIEGLIFCPFCPFGAVLDDPNQKILRCQNPECMRESCIKCQAPSHVPYRCEEVANLKKKYNAEEFRKMIEDEMANALIEHCPKCNTGFTKSDGCNKVMCTCGKYYVCWICKEPLDLKNPYEHFNKQGANCELYSSDAQQAAREKARILEAGKRAREQFLKDNPFKDDINVNPFDDLEKVLDIKPTKKAKKNNRR